MQARQAENPLIHPLRVFVLEDDALLRERVLAPKLRQFGFDVVALANIAQLHEAVSGGAPDIFLLDVNLPDGNGFNLASSLRETMPTTGIVMLTGRSERSDHVRGLTGGADAYLAKPVEIDLLVATLHSVARRLIPDARPRGKWSLSPDEWFLLAPSGMRVMLSKTERQLMEVFIQQANEVMSRKKLIAALTEDVLAFDPHRLDSLVYRLRRKVLSIAGEPLPLNAVHGTGYVLQV